MNWFSTPKRLENSDIVLYAVITPAMLLFAPDSAFARTNVDWLFGLVVLLPVSFIAGLLSYQIYYRRHDFTCIDPFYIRAWLTMIGGAIAWPVCLLFRPSAADFAFILFTFGAGPVVAFHVRRKIREHRGDQPAATTDTRVSRR